MKKAILLSAVLAIFLWSCALIPHRVRPIDWPENITYMAALCELDMSWKGMKYSGSMALVINYPSTLQIEIYGPFGETLLVVKKEGDDFLLATRGEQFTDPRFFEDRFGIKLDDFMDDLAMMSKRDRIGGGNGLVERGSYRVIYRFDDGRDSLCWEGKDGSICVAFVEVTFEKKDFLEKGNNGNAG